MANDFKALIEAQKETTRAVMTAEQRAEMDAAIAEEQHNEKIKNENRIEGGRKAWQTRQANKELAAGGAAAKEDAQEAAASEKKTQGLLGKIAGGVTGMFGKMGEKVKGAGKGIMAMLKGTLVAGLLLAVMAFLESKYWTDTKAFIVDKVVPMLVNFYENILKPIGVIFADLFIATWENIKELFSGLGESFDLFANGEWWEGIKTMITSIGTFLGNLIDDVLTAVYNVIATVFGLDKTDSVFGSIWGLLTDTYNEFVSWITLTWENIKTTINETFDGIKTFFVDTFNFISDGIAGAWTNVTDFIKGIWDSAIGWFEGLWTWASEGIAAGWTNVTTFIKGVFDKVVSWFEGLWTWASEGVAGAWTGITNFVTTQFGSVVKFIEDLFTWPDSPAGFAIKLIDLVLAPYNLAINFIKDIFGWGDPDESFSLGTFVVDIFKKVKDWFTNIFDFKVSDVLPDFELPNFGEMIKGIVRAVFPTSLFDKTFFGYGLRDFLPDSLTKFLTEEPDKKLARGGSFQAGQSLLVGELGPELILPSTGGQVKSAERTQQIQAAGLRRGADGSGTSGPAVVNAPVNTVNNSQNNTSVTATPITNQTPIMQLVNAAN